MGWSELDGGVMDGDGPADAMAEAFATIVDETSRHTGRAPKVREILEGVVAALRLDGALAPFHGERHHVQSIVVAHAKKKATLRASGAEAPPWIVAALYGTFDTIAEEYTNVWDRPPSMRELLHYLDSNIGREMEEGGITDGNWRVGEAKVLYEKAPKPPDRVEPPDVAEPEDASRERVVHARFGAGTVVARRGETVDVAFDDGTRRTLKRDFLRPG